MYLEPTDLINKYVVVVVTSETYLDIILGAPQRAKRHWQGAGARWAREGFDTTKTSKVYVTFIQ